MDCLFNCDVRLLNKFYSQLGDNNHDFELSSYMQKFCQLKTNLERINFVYGDLQKYNLFPKYIRNKKCDVSSIDCRKNGNLKFTVGAYDKAMLQYTKSVGFAASPDKLALAYANRSACLYKLHRYKDCLKDIGRALSLNYPETLKPKLIDRRKNAYNKIKKTRHLSSFHEAIPEIPSSEQHPKIQCAKNCIEIESNEKYGRYVVATRDIKIGEVITIENSYATFFNTEPQMYCDFCLELCYNPIPCKTCSFLFFCGEACRDLAFESYHKVECAILPSLLELEMTSLDGIALRVALKAKNENLLPLTSDEDVYKSDRFKEINKLYSGNGQFSEIKMLYLSIISSYIIYFLTKKTNFFDGNEDDKFKELILSQLQIAKLNYVMIQQTADPASVNVMIETFAYGLYSFSSLFNHSCAPNIEKIFHGNRIVLKTINTIKRGEQCFLSYGVTYDRSEKSERQEFLDKFLFSCDCKACVKQWELIACFDEHKTLFFKEFNVDIFQMLRMEEKMIHNINALKNFLPKLERQLKKIEHLEPWNNSGMLKNLIAGYYKIFGNRKFNFA